MASDTDTLHYSIEVFIAKLDEQGSNGKPIEMTRLFAFTTFDIMADLCFGHPLGLLENNKFSPWVKSIFDSCKMLPIMSMIGYYPLLNALFTRFEPKAVTEQRILHCKHSADRVDQRLKEGSDQPDIWNLVMTSKTELSIEEMHSNAEIFMFARTETTATLLSGLLYYLLMNPSTMKLLTDEVRSTFESPDDISFTTVAQLPYLNACLKEGLRIYPPVPIGSPRIVAPGGKVIHGQWIPAETRVSVHHYSTYLSEENFKNADKFVPERWLDDPLYADDARDAHQPFGFGHRNCLGQNMAMHEMRLILARVLLSFDFELCDVSKRWTEQKTFALWEKQELMCRLKAR